MTVTDEAKLFAVRQQLLEMRFKLDASIKIINYVFDRDESSNEVDGHHEPSRVLNTRDPVTGLFPGQLPNVEDVEEEAECLE